MFIFDGCGQKTGNFQITSVLNYLTMLFCQILQQLNLSSEKVGPGAAAGTKLWGVEAVEGKISDKPITLWQTTNIFQNIYLSIYLSIESNLI